MANKSKRFKKPAAEADSPGPAAYTLHKRADWIKEIGRSGASSAPAATKEGSTQKGTVSYTVIRKQKLCLIMFTYGKCTQGKRLCFVKHICEAIVFIDLFCFASCS